MARLASRIPWAYTGRRILAAIPTMLAYAFFRTRTQRYIGELEAASSHLVALLQTLTVRAPNTGSTAPRNKDYQLSAGQDS